MKKKVNNSTDANNGEVPKQKERHIVSWSQEEDDILREQIRLHGTENWAIIASKFKDKTTRQCRRRWFTYLNSDFKRGGWSPEEDMLLCEAQKIFGNRWTEIAKVVSGRTDNAVKNRFTTLCKKRAKREALAKENNTISYINLNNKRVVFPNGLNIGVGSESAPPLKKTRAYISSTTESEEDKLAGECAIADHLLRAPFAVLAQNVHGFKVNLPTPLHGSHIKEASTDGSESDRSQGTFLRKDDPKLLALMQQAELLSSLAIKVNSEKTDQSLESAWLAVQDFLKQNKESDLLTCRNPDTDFQFEKFKELVEDLRSCNEGSRPSWREPDLYESSPASSEYSTGSTQLSNVQSDKSEECQAEICLPHEETGLQSNQLDNQKGLAEEHGMCHTANTKNEVNMLACNDVKDDDGVVCEYSSTEFGSPVHVTPIFRALAATIPSPKFSESEKHFLMKTLGMESTSPSPITNPSQPPQCKSNLDLSFSRIGLRRSAFGSSVLWSILLFLLKIDRYHLHPRV
ncbi:Transcription factor [Sesamum angolense]|uniref:Transcription factor n=1 Tax=Sesamum angolense TaxID=2727404 RepID=A0AAE2BZ09_9LAMI|nr:Transcription factor [Sesamum angolense]